MRAGKLIRLSFILVIVLLAAPAFAVPITLRLDATEAPRRIYHAELVIPASPGPFTLFYPKWIPAENAPTGPITVVAGLKLSSVGKHMVMKRHPVELFAI